MMGRISYTAEEWRVRDSVVGFLGNIWKIGLHEFEADSIFSAERQIFPTRGKAGAHLRTLAQRAREGIDG